MKLQKKSFPVAVECAFSTSNIQVYIKEIGLECEDVVSIRLA
jgi:hypothetical protein